MKSVPVDRIGDPSGERHDRVLGCAGAGETTDRHGVTGMDELTASSAETTLPERGTRMRSVDSVWAVELTLMKIRRWRVPNSVTQITFPTIV